VASFFTRASAALDRSVVRLNPLRTNEGFGQAIFDLRAHAPTTRPTRLPPARLAVIAGRGDRITPPDHAEELAQHWGVEVTWFPGGHLAQLGRGEALRAVRRRLGALALPGRELRS
jgi:pimeloyl-ACP methyl ester carboxylesterase